MVIYMGIYMGYIYGLYVWYSIVGKGLYIWVIYMGYIYGLYIYGLYVWYSTVGKGSYIGMAGVYSRGSVYCMVNSVRDPYSRVGPALSPFFFMSVCERTRWVTGTGPYLRRVY